MLDLILTTFFAFATWSKVGRASFSAGGKNRDGEAQCCWGGERGGGRGGGSTWVGRAQVRAPVSVDRVPTAQHLGLIER